MNIKRAQLQIADFYIGLEFYLGDKKYRCTDVESRTVIAIRIDGVNVVKFDTGTGIKETFFETEDEQWYEGPPYWSIKGLEKTLDPPQPPKDATTKEKMAHLFRTRNGKERYKLRKETVEPVFGIIKSVMGFRQFLLRGKEKVDIEWDLVTLFYNLKRMHKLNDGRRLSTLL